MADDEITNNLRESLGLMAVLVTSLEDFATQILAKAFSAGTLHGDAIQTIKQQCIINLKNSHFERVSIEKEAKIFGKAINELNKLIDNAIANARESKEGN